MVREVVSESDKIYELLHEAVKNIEESLVRFEEEDVFITFLEHKNGKFQDIYFVNTEDFYKESQRLQEIGGKSFYYAQRAIKKANDLLNGSEKSTLVVTDVGEDILRFDSKWDTSMKKLAKKYHVRSVVSTAIVFDKKPIGLINFFYNMTLYKKDDAFWRLQAICNCEFVAYLLIRSMDQSELFLGTIKALSAAIDAKSPWTAGHSERVTEIALQIGKMYELSPEQEKTLELAGLLHDIGKIGLSEKIINKKGYPTKKEWKEIKKHPIKGCEILSSIKIFEEVVPIIRAHHERPDGEGYPDNLKGDEIHLLSKILKVADAFDAMRSERPDSPEMTPNEIKQIFINESGSEFDPDVKQKVLYLIDQKILK